jgi:hypothetical protein
MTRIQPCSNSNPLALIHVELAKNWHRSTGLRRLQWVDCDRCAGRQRCVPASREAVAAPTWVWNRGGYASLSPSLAELVTTASRILPPAIEGPSANITGACYSLDTSTFRVVLIGHKLALFGEEAFNSWDDYDSVVRQPLRAFQY